MKARLNILVALPAEAKAVNRILGLRRVQPDEELPLYAADDIALVLTGPGMTATAAGVDTLHRRNGNTDTHWLNIGIAGHGAMPIGQAMLASSVEAPSSGEVWNLQVPDHMDCPISPLKTVLQPVSDYPDPVAYDMEAAGFIGKAMAFAPPDRIHVLKIVSDNPHNPSRAINAKMVTTLILEQSTLIEQLIERILRDHV